MKPLTSDVKKKQERNRMNTKEKLCSGEPVFMVKLLYQDPALFELVGMLGFDCVWICNEHIGIDPSRMESLIRACRISGMDAVVRVKPANYQALLHPLEFGAKGIMCPRVQDADEVRELVRNIKFYPEGRRGVDGVNAEAGFGLIPFQEYLVRANRENFLIVQIEDPEAVEHIEEIAAVDGVDVLFVGPADLSLNLGIAGQFCHPKMMDVYERVCNACRKYGKTAGLSCAFDKIPEFMEQGFRFFVGGADYLVIRNGYMNLREQLLKNGFTMRPVAAP